MALLVPAAIGGLVACCLYVRHTKNNQFDNYDDPGNPPSGDQGLPQLLPLGNVGGHAGPGDNPSGGVSLVRGTFQTLQADVVTTPALTTQGGSQSNSEPVYAEVDSEYLRKKREQRRRLQAGSQGSAGQQQPNTLAYATIAHDTQASETTEEQLQQAFFNAVRQGDEKLKEFLKQLSRKQKKQLLKNRMGKYGGTALSVIANLNNTSLNTDG